MSRQYAMLVQKSYARCSRSKGFFDDFYHGLIASSDEIREHFADISRVKQKMFALNGVSTILLFAMGSAKSEERLDTLVGKHRSEAMNIRPDLYPNWADALLFAVSKHDPEFGPELDQAWRATVQVGLDKFVPSD